MNTMDGSVFEGLARQLKPTGAFADELKQAGFDPERLEAKYDEAVFARTIEVAARHVFPEVLLEVAHTKLGNALIDGYFETILGRVTGALMPVLGVGGALKRVQRLWTIAHHAMRITAENDGPNTWAISFSNAVMTSDLVAGILQAALSRADKRVKVHVVTRMPGGGTLRVTLE